MDMICCLLLISLVGCIQSRTYYMDSPTACGQRISVADDSIVVEPKGTVGVSNPPTNCIITFESSYSSNNYKFEIVFERFRFVDCGMTLRIFDGDSVGGAYIKNMGCSSTATTGYLYSKTRAVTIQLTRTQQIYNYGNDFSLRISVYKDPSAAADFHGTDQFPVGGIVGIVLGIVVIVAFAILLGWCYKTGRLAGLTGDYYDEPISAKIDNTKINHIPPENGNENNGFRTWHNVEKVSNLSDSRSNFTLDNDHIMTSLMNVSNTVKTRNTNIRETENPGGRNVNQGRNEKNYERSNSNSGMRVERTASISRTPGSSPGPKRSRKVDPPKAPSLPNFDKLKSGDFDRGELGLRGSDHSMRRRGSTGAVEKEDKTDVKRPKSGMFENPDKDGYLYDYDQVKNLTGDDKPPARKTQDFASELQSAIKRNSMKRMNSVNQSDPDKSDAPGAPGINNVKASNDLDDSGSSDTMNRQTDGETTGPEAHSSPKPDRKKRKTPRERKSPKSPRKNDNYNTEHSPKTKSKRNNDEDVPPEIYAPIFSDDNDNQDYDSNQYQPGYQSGYPMHYDPRYPMGGQYPPPGIPPMYPGMPFQQAGQAQWYVENTPTGQQKMAFAMTTHSQNSQDDTINYGDGMGRPNYQSTPYYNNQYGAPQGHNQRSKHPSNALVPAGTILDDPGIPPPGMSVARYHDDPHTGVKTSQVVWTDSKPDPTDPPPGSEGPQITRKTITRVTTKATQDDLPDAPNIQDLSHKTAQEMQATGQDPPFMSPSRGAATTYNPYNAIQYGSQTPEHPYPGLYKGGHRNNRDHIPGSPIPLVHEVPKAHNAFKDRITLNESESLHAQNRAKASDGKDQEMDRLLTTD